MSKRNNRSNTTAASNNNIRVKARYVAKHSEKITIDFNGKKVEIRRIWDSKKRELLAELRELTQIPDMFKRNLSVIAACLSAVGLEWSDAPLKELGKVTWREGDKVCEAPSVRIKFLKNGGQLRMVRNTDGTERVDLDIVTKETVNRCIKDCQDWSDEDQAALDSYNAAASRRRADRERHEHYERTCISSFSCDEAFTSVGL